MWQSVPILDSPSTDRSGAVSGHIWMDQLQAPRTYRSADAGVPLDRSGSRNDASLT
jgi:hypothetical protein